MTYHRWSYWPWFKSSLRCCLAHQSLCQWSLQRCQSHSYRSSRGSKRYTAQFQYACTLAHCFDSGRWHLWQQMRSQWLPQEACKQLQCTSNESHSHWLWAKEAYPACQTIGTCSPASCQLVQASILNSFDFGFSFQLWSEIIVSLFLISYVIITFENKLAVMMK